MTRLTTTLLVGSAIVGLSACTLPQLPSLPEEPKVCTEDMDCWDWRTMGNQTRGICVEGRWHLEHADGTVTDDHPFGYEACT